LRKARNKNTDSAIKFIYSSDETLAAEGKYTAIFCLSVLCRWEDTKDLADCSDVYPFWRFDETVSFLSEQLEENGILVIYNSNFRFEDTAVSGGFEILSTPAMSDSGFVHKFDSYNKRIYLHHRHCIYRKKATAKP
jgi:hypothetical protein